MIHSRIIVGKNSIQNCNGLILSKNWCVLTLTPNWLKFWHALKYNQKTSSTKKIAFDTLEKYS
jgi:hypothetical protein